MDFVGASIRVQMKDAKGDHASVREALHAMQTRAEAAERALKDESAMARVCIVSCSNCLC
jgi:hypothetical protein